MRHYSFESQQLLPVVAHNGKGRVLTRRVEEAERIGLSNFIDLTEVPSEATIGYHRHSDDNEEIYIVVSGHGRITVDGEELEVGPGHVIVNSPGGAHGLENTGTGALALVVIEVARNSPRRKVRR